MYSISLLPASFRAYNAILNCSFLLYSLLFSSLSSLLLSSPLFCCIECSDNIRAGSEECDSTGNGCRANCTCDASLGYSPAPGGAATCATRMNRYIYSHPIRFPPTITNYNSSLYQYLNIECGDNIRSGTEQCDNTADTNCIACVCNTTAGFHPAGSNGRTCVSRKF